MILIWLHIPIYEEDDEEEEKEVEEGGRNIMKRTGRRKVQAMKISTMTQNRQLDTFTQKNIPLDFVTL